MEHKYIDADALMEKLDDLRPANLNTLYAVENIICEMPAADVEPVRHGEWQSKDGYWHCSICNHPAFHNHWDYCPNCGARMDGGNE